MGKIAMRKPLPSKKLLEFSSKFEAAKSPEEAWDALLHQVQNFGLEMGSYASFTKLRSGSTKDDMTFFSSYPERFLSTYIDEILIDHDYCVHHCLKSSEVSFWSDIKHKAPDHGQAHYRSISEDFSLREGIIVPLSATNGLIASGVGFSLSSSDFDTAKYLTGRNIKKG